MESGPLTDVLLGQLLAASCTAKEVARQRADPQLQEAAPLTAQGIEDNVRALMVEQREHLAKVLEGVKSAVEKVGMPMPAGIQPGRKPRKRRVSKRP